MVGSLSPKERNQLLTSLTPQQTAELEWDWKFWARPNQLPPDLSQSGAAWQTWILLAGRGFGKTRVGAEFVRSQVELGKVGRVALVAPTAGDARDIMVEGESGLLSVCPPWNRPMWEPTKRRVTWPSGAIATTYSADEPERLRGPQHDLSWCDELCSWRYPDTWDQMQLGLRLGLSPRTVVTTTPKPIKLVKRILADPMTAITRGSTFENAANLAGSFIHGIEQAYEGTRLGRQEIYAEVLEDVDGALWTTEMIEAARWPRDVSPPPMRRVVVAVDPAVSSTKTSDETGIIVVGISADNRAFVLEDLSCRTSPEKWVREAIRAFHTHRADRIIGEVNNGGDLIESLLRSVDRSIPYKAVRASRGKFVRAEPASALYEQNRVWHVGTFPKLEEQMCQFSADMNRAAYGSPDRVDALVWGLTELVLQNQMTGLLDYYRREFEERRAGMGAMSG